MPMAVRFELSQAAQRDTDETQEVIIGNRNILDGHDSDIGAIPIAKALCEFYVESGCPA